VIAELIAENASAVTMSSAINLLRVIMVVFLL